MSSLDHLTESDLAGYLGQDLTPDRRQRIEAHLDGCSECRAEFVAVGHLAAESSEGLRSARRRLPSRWLVPAALAAGLVGLFLVRSPPWATGPAPLERPAHGPSESLPRIEIAAPADGASIAADRITFRWHSTSADGYRITLLTETGEPVWTEDTPDTAVTLPATVRLEAGRHYFWQVAAVAEGIAATTGIHRFQVAR